MARESKPRPRLWRRPRFWIASGLLLAALLFAAPALIARFGMLDAAVAWAAPKLRGRLAIADASLGWFTSVELRGVKLTDAEGQIVVEIPQISGTKSLLQLATNRSDLGEFALESPSANVVFAGDSSNLEKLLAELA
ncbi:MAG TPA: hypothetical protein VNC50_09225, partial [Planctomycetia bacterium]|nr:hypothetical protein [Planctomycetia bacterium]